MAAANLKEVPKQENVVITAPRLRTATFHIVGTAPYCQHRFSQKALEKMKTTQKAGSQARSKKIRDARNFEADYEAAKHISEDGWLGIPAPAIRSAMIDACRMVGFKMTMAKLSVFVEADGIDKVDGMPLIKIKGDCEMHEGGARNSNGNLDIRVRPLWRKWEADIRIRFDEDQFSLIDVTNLLARAGIQVGIGEGRPNSRMSSGIGWGTFEIAN